MMAYLLLILVLFKPKIGLITIYIHRLNIFTGSTHCAAWSGAISASRPVNRFNLGTPQHIPPCYSSLFNMDHNLLRDRLNVLWCFSELVSKNWKLLSLNNKVLLLLLPFTPSSFFSSAKKRVLKLIFSLSFLKSEAPILFLICS